MENQKPSQSQGSFGAVYFLALIAALALLGYGLRVAMQHQGYVLLATGAASTIAVLIAWPIAMLIDSSRKTLEAEHISMHMMMRDRLQELCTLLGTVSEQQLLSDRAKAVAYREKDREALRRAIREEMGKKDWDAALVLANDMESQFGYTQEAGTLRAEINNNRTEVVRKQTSETANIIDQHIRGERWTQAFREADQLAMIYPNDEQVKRLPGDIENRRQAHKRQLTESWKESVNRKDVDGSIEILKKLDAYLTPAEAESMQETARGIFKEKLANLKAQFSKAYHEDNLTEAIRIGETITKDFPNSRIALEIKESMESLKQKAGSAV